MGTGTVRFKGSLDKPGTVLVGTNAATMSQTTNFTGLADVTLGTNVITVKATDYYAHIRTNQFQLVVTNQAVAKTLAYDANGNLTNAVTTTTTNSYLWDAADRLIRITQLTNAITFISEFTYDGLGRRTQIIEKTNGVAISTNKFLWVGTELCEQRNNTGATVTKRFFDQGEQISGTNYYFTTDHLGSIREMTTAAGVIAARYDYDPYGRRTKISGGIDADFAFTGHYYHAPSGLHLAMYRAYDAETGRWISRDPIEEAGGLNLYAYVLNAPVDFIDPQGLSVATWIIRVFTQSGKLIRQIRELQKTKAIELTKKALKAAGPQAIVQCENKKKAELIGQALSTDNKLTTRTGKAWEKGGSYPEHVHPNAGPNVGAHIQVHPPGTTYYGLGVGFLASVFAAQSQEIGQNPEASQCDVAVAAAWDLLSDVDPTGVSDLMYWLFEP